MKMTPELAVEILRASEQECWLKGWSKGDAVDYVYNLASKWVAKALEQEPCEDAVSRSSLLGKLDDCYKEKVKIAPDNMAEGFAQVEKLIKQEPPITPARKEWIPVSERFPEEHLCDDGFVEPSEPVLVQLNNKDMKVSRYWGSREKYKDKPWIDLSYPTTLEVVAWMPLPGPYEEREGEE